MNEDLPIGILELGNINIKCIIFKTQDDKVEILSTHIAKSEGIHNDIIMNISKASIAIRHCISKAEEKAKISLKKINLVFEQTDFLCTKFSKHKKIDGSKIHKDDIDFLLKEAKKQLSLNDNKQSIIHIFNHNYVVDGKKFTDEPIGVYADSLTHEITFVTTPKNNLKNINQVFIDCDIEISRVFSRVFSLGVNLLSHKELEFGSAIIDLSFEKSSFGLFKNLALVHSITLPIGTNHITKDISKVCSLSLGEAENIRNNIDFSFENNKNIFNEDGYLKENYFTNSNFRKISKNLIINIIKSRLEEIFEKLKKQLIVPGFSLNSGINIFLTGEGASLVNIEKYFANVFTYNIKKINNNHYSEENSDIKTNFASCFGALKIIKDGWETEAIPEEDKDDLKQIGFFDKFFR